MKKKVYKTEMNEVINKYQEVQEPYSAKHTSINLTTPPNFRMLCALLGVKPAQVLNDFITAVSSSYKKDFPIEQGKAAVQYFLECHYGKLYFDKEDIAVMLQELEALRLIEETMDRSVSSEMNLYFCFKHMQAQQWFKRWFNKSKRKESISILNEY